VAHDEDAEGGMEMVIDILIGALLIVCLDATRQWLRSEAVF
jgi:hypothetical protein